MKGKKPKKTGLWGHKALIIIGAIVVTLYAAAGYKAFHAKPIKPPVPVYYEHAADAMPFPATLDPAKFKPADVREAYQVAKKIPGVLAQQPCYCYCQRQGHRGLLDCFRTQHAATCNICIKEALLAGRMHGQGKSAEEIRTAIIRGDWAHILLSTELTNPQINDEGETQK